MSAMCVHVSYIQRAATRCPAESNRSRQSEVMNDGLSLEFHHRRRRIGARIQSHCLPRSFRAPHQRRQHRETRAGRGGTALSGQLRRQRTAQRHDQYHRPHHARPDRPSGSPTARGVGARVNRSGRQLLLGLGDDQRTQTERIEAMLARRVDRAGGHAAARRQHRSVPG